MADAFEPQIRVLLAEWPKMPAPVIAERISWPYSSGPLKKELQKLRPEYVGIDPVDHAELLTLTGDSYPTRTRRELHGKSRTNND